MIFDMIAAAALASTQGSGGETPFTSFDNSIPGWSVVRRPDGCFSYTTGGGPADTSLNIFYKVDEGAAPSLILLFSNESWRLPEESVRGFRIQFVGSDGDWTNLSGDSLQDMGDGDNIGIVSLDFDETAIPLMLTDVVRGTGLNFYRDTGLLDRLLLPNSPAAVGRLLDCVRTVTTQPIATVPTR